jgi:hypothetical protein
MNKTPEHRRALAAWKVMRRRCLEPKFKDFPRYGGAGILICPQWLVSFEQFYRDVGPPPTLAHWFGRIDTAAHYTAGNVIWTTRAEQMNRRQYCRQVVIDGEKVTAAQAGRMPGQPTRNTVLRRWDSGFNLSAPAPARLYPSSRWLTHDGVTLPLPEWARRVGIIPRLLWVRLDSGMPLARALSPHRLTRQKDHPMKKPSPSPTHTTAQPSPEVEKGAARARTAVLLKGAIRRETIERDLLSLTPAEAEGYARQIAVALDLAQVFDVLSFHVVDAPDGTRQGLAAVFEFPNPEQAA